MFFVAFENVIEVLPS